MSSIQSRIRKTKIYREVPWAPPDPGVQELADAEAAILALAEGHKKSASFLQSIGQEHPSDPVAEVKNEEILEPVTQADLIGNGQIVSLPASIDLTVLGKTVGEIAATLETGSLDAFLTELLAAEEAGKNRKGAVAAIKARIPV